MNRMNIVPLFLLVSFSAASQTIDYNKIILPEHVRTSDFGEKLVQIAWRNHPLNEVYRREMAIANVNVRASTVDWLNTVRVSANMNEFTLNPEADIFGRAAFYPRYNIGLAI